MGQRTGRGDGHSGLIRIAGAVLTVLATAWVTGGCAQNELGVYSGYNPSSVIVRNDKRIRFPIVKTEDYWVQRDVQPEEQFPGPTPEDLKPTTADYVLGSGDLIDITVFELMAPGQPYISRQRISQSGQITFPYIGTVHCKGLTTRGLEDKIADMLEPDYIIGAQVSVFVMEYRNLNVSVLNGVYRSGIYPMTKQDMTLLELVAMAGGILQLTEDYGYIIRVYTPDEADILMLEAGVAPSEAEAKGPLGGPAVRAPADRGGGRAAGKAAEKDKAAPEAAPKAGEKPAAEGAPKAGEKPAAEGAPKADEKPNAEGAPKADEKTGPEVAPKPAEKPAAAAPSESSNRQVRELLEKMAEGEVPPVSRIEAAEAAGAAGQPAGEKASSAPGNNPSAPEKTPAVGDAKAAPEKAASAPDAKAGPEKTPAAQAKESADAARTVGGDAAAQALAKDEEELSRWIWSDGKFVEVKPKTAPGAVKTATGTAKMGEAPKVAEGTRPAEGTKPPEPAKVAEVAKGGEAAKPTDVAKAPAGARGAEAAVEGKEPQADGTRLQLEQKLRRMGVVQGGGQLKRIIRFDVKALQSGDPTQNVVLRDSDIVTIPSPAIGDFYMGGEIARPGVYSLTGRKMTLLQAVMAAGGLTAVAVPWRTEIMRRVSETEEEIIYMDLGKISRGEAPDCYLQPEDQIRVGTDQGAIFNAVLRNAFRATYGLGSVYDMNFADFYPWATRALPIMGVSPNR